MKLGLTFARRTKVCSIPKCFHIKVVGYTPVYLQVDFTNWAPNEPILGDTADCVRMKNDLSMFAMWRDSVCDETWPYVCKKQKSKMG